MFLAFGLVESGIGALVDCSGFDVQESYFKTALMHSCSWLFGCSFLVVVYNQFRYIYVSFVVVISALDELKKYDSGARDATKFLEQEFKKGNR